MDEYDNYNTKNLSQSQYETLRRVNNSNAAIRKKKSINPFVMVIISFASIIVIGTILLFLPWSQTGKTWSNMGGADGSSWAKNLLDCFFTSVSSTCVTGLNVFNNGIGEDLTFFGQLVVLIMIQIGGLGFFTLLAFFLTMFSLRVKFKDKLFFMRATGSESFGHVFGFVRKIILITITAELIGALLCIPVFKEYAELHGEGWKHIIWYCVFHSVSSFNNAGFDIMGSTSLISTAGWTSELSSGMYNYLLVVTAILIVVGGLSFLTIIDVFSFKKPKRWRAFTKVVLTTSIILLVVGSVLFMLFECPNGLSPLEAIFQAVTCRTAGFATISQDQLSVGSRILSCLLMFIGGSPMSTAGGIKTTTIFIVVLSLSSFISGRDLHAFKRSYSPKVALKALSLISISIAVLVVSFGVIASIEAAWNSSYWANSSDISSFLLFECISAFSNTGLSMGVTTNLVWGSELVLTILMFVGRLGPMTLFQIFQVNMDKQSKVHYKFVEEDFLVG